MLIWQQIIPWPLCAWLDPDSVVIRLPQRMLESRVFTSVVGIRSFEVILDVARIVYLADQVRLLLGGITDAPAL